MAHRVAISPVVRSIRALERPHQPTPVNPAHIRRSTEACAFPRASAGTAREWRPQ